MSDSFDDPELKAAVRKGWSAQSAPAGLRQRVMALPAMPIAAPVAAPVAPGWITSLFARAMAASILICTGIQLLDVMTALPEHTLPEGIAAAMIQTHDRCCRLNDHHFVPQRFANLMSTTGRWLSSKANVPVLSVRVSDGWIYCGAGPCKVGDATSGHLLFKRGKQELSIFSVRSGAFALPPVEQTFDITNDQEHFCAAFTEHGGLYCAISHDPEGKFGAGDLEAVRQILIADYPTATFSAAAANTRPPPLASILLGD